MPLPRTFIVRLSANSLLTSSLIIGLTVLVGCNNSKETPTAADAPGANGSEQGSGTAGGPVVEDRVLQVTPEMGLGDYLPPLEGGRLEIAPPADWKIMGRRTGYVTRFYQSDPKAVPRIAVTSEDSPFDGMNDLNEDNVKEFARLVGERLEAEGAKLLEPVLPMMIGSNPAARYVTAAKADGLVVERQILVTLADGRLYTVDMQVLPRTIKQHKDAGYAVLAGMKFSPPAEPAPTDPAPSDPAPSEPPPAESDATGFPAPATDPE